LDENKFSKSISEIAKKIADLFYGGYLTEGIDFINSVLRFVFHDREYTVSINVEEKRNQKELYFSLNEIIDGNLITTDIDNIGSGIKGVISFALQIFYIDKTKSGKYLFLDEPFTEISDSYLENLFVMIKKISDAKGFNILIISHDERIISNFKDIYEVVKGKIVKRK
jgi:ABC-type lipoprotein export system ATPase subunit